MPFSPLSTLFPSLLVFLFVSLGSACSVSTDTNSQTAILSITHPVISETTKQKSRTKSENSLNLPSEADKILVIVEDQSGAVINQGDILAIEDSLNFSVPTEIALTLKGEIWSGEELLYAGEQSIKPLFTGEHRPISLTVDSLVSIDIPNPVNTKAGQTQTYQLDIQGLKDKTITWYVNDIAGGNESIGTIDASGNYTAPLNPTEVEVTIKAIPNAAPTFTKSFVNTLIEPPSDTPLINAIAGNAKIDLEWDFIQEATEYLLYRFDKTDPTPQQIFTSTDNTFTDKTVNNGTMYSYYILPRNIAGDGENSLTISVTPLNPTPPNKPSGLQAKPLNNAVQLTWARAAKADRYLLYRVEDLADLATTAPLTTTSSLSYRDNGVLNGTEYFYALIAKNDIGESDISESIAVVPALSDDINDVLPLVVDDNLRQCIKEQNVLKASELFVLKCNEQDIVSLIGLEWFTELIELELYGNLIEDIQPISKLINLKKLSLGKLIETFETYTLYMGNSIVDISPIRNLTNLVKLDLSKNLISDLSPLSNLLLLTTLSLDSNKIVNVNPISNLTSISQLWLDENNISDINPLSNLTTLTNLTLHANQITDISVISNLTSLYGFGIADNLITDISPLANVISLTELFLNANLIIDITPIENLISLTHLSIESNQISDISPMSKLSSLTWLFMDDNEIDDINPISTLTSLSSLGIDNNSVTDISPLANLTSLTQLYMSNNQIEDVSPLNSLNKLSALELNDNENLTCLSIETLDSQLDVSDGSTSGIVKWDSCIP